MKRHLGSIMTALAVGFAATAQAATLGFVQDFNVDAGGFGGGSQSYDLFVSGGVGGALDGYLRIANDDFEKQLGTRSFAPELTGDLLAAGVTGFSFWVNDVGGNDGIEAHIGVGNASNFWINTAGFNAPNNAWAEVTVDLTSPGDWTQVIGGGTFADALTNHDRLHFRHDTAPYGQFPTTLQGDFGLDRITVLPEPGSLALLSLGGMFLLRRRIA